MSHGSGIYVHYPYCARKCPYCDFNSRADAPSQERYAAAVARELALRAPAFGDAGFTSIFFGGGTPSLWEPACVASVLDAARRAVRLAPEPEATIELNPGTVTPARLCGYRAAGLTRASIGAQSLDAGELERLGRIHGPAEALAAIESARAAGFARVGVDLICGAPGQTVASLSRSLRLAVEAGVDHVSVYALTICPDTPFGRADPVALGLPADEEEVELYEAARALLAGAGLVHYEISNWARPGAECVHNLNCWEGGHYLGAGAGAHGHAPGAGPGEGTRYSDEPDAGAYMEALARGALPTAFTERIDRATRGRELIYTGLRMMRGLDLAALAAGATDGDADRVRAAAPRLADEGLVIYDGRTVRLTERGELFADRVAVGLI